MKRGSVLSNFIWRFAERVGAQGVRLLVELVLARVLLPDDYGLIALVTVFITILNVFVDSGLGNALIQKKDADDLDFSSVFWFNIIWCIILYGLLFIISPFLASFYGRIELTGVLRILGLQVIISGVKNVQQAYVSRTMQFKRFFFATLGGTIGAAFIGIWMAYNGYGVWALVAQQLFNTLIDTIILWITVKWRPKRQFSLARLKKMFTYGWKLLVSALLDTIDAQIHQLIIGKRYSSSDLAFYNRGTQYPSFIVGNVNTAIDSVLLPVMSKAQDSADEVKAMTRRAMKISTYVMAPMMMGLAFIGEPVVRLLLTEKWLPCVPFMRIFCINHMFFSVHTANLNAIKALGRSDMFLKLEIAKKIVSLVILFISMNISVEAIAYSTLLINVINMAINNFPNRKLLNYGLGQQMKDIMPSILLSIFMGMCVYFVSYLNLPDIIICIIQIILGAFIYLASSYLLKFESLTYIVRTIIGHIKNERE